MDELELSNLKMSSEPRAAKTYNFLYCLFGQDPSGPYCASASWLWTLISVCRPSTYSSLCRMALIEVSGLKASRI